VGLWICRPVAFAAEEVCASCSQQRISGDFVHRKDDATVAIQGAANNAAAFREEINGKNFTISILNLPADKYTITIGEVETLLNNSGERLFNVSSGDVSLASNFDIFATAGGAKKVCNITGRVEHEDDSLRGPLTITFTAVKNIAKFNTVEIKDASGAAVFTFNASRFADAFSAEAARIPEINEPPIWRDPAQSLQSRANDLIRRMSLAEKVAQLRNGAPAIQRLGLPAYDYWNEALHGVANNGIATVFPQAIGMAATWDPQLIQQEASVIGVEGRAKFNDYASKHNGDSKWFSGLTFWSPNINIFRDPRWGRGQETYGEDPFLSGTLGVAFIKGLQGDDPQYMKAMACAKHYAVHSGPEPERHRFDARPSDRDLYETYLPHFEMAVREGHVGGVMGAYNAVNGVPACASSFLLIDLLRNQWKFDGYIVSDCGAINDIWNTRAHRYVDTPEKASAAAVKAGCNLCCGGDYNALVQAVQNGLISEKEIDQALFYTLWTRFRLGLFDPPERCPYSKIGIDQNDTPEHRQLALKVARETIVLLKNDGLLPLDRSKVKKIAVFGENATDQRMLWGNYNGTPSRSVTILNGIRELAGANIEVTYAQGCPLVTRSANTGAGRQGFAGTKDPGLYLSEHYSMDSFSCKLPNGKYLAKLYFAETFEGISGPGQRVFSFNIQGREFKNFDIWAKAGGPNRAYIETVPVEVTNGNFRIVFTRQVENPAINAIEIIPQIATETSAGASAPTAKAIRIKAGKSTPFTDSSGQVWSADQGFEGGATIDHDTATAIGGGGQLAAPTRPLPELRDEALRIAGDSDVLIYVGGINSQLEGEEGNVRGTRGVEGFNGGDRTRIELPQVQEDFIRALHETGKPVVMVNCSGSAMAIPWEAKHLPAIFQAWYPGEEGGRAVGEILFGDVNPSGHLPVTFYGSTADLPDFRDYSMSNRTYRYFNGKPLFAFGHGLSYTKFTFQDGKLDSEKIPVNGIAKVSFKTENTGSLDGDEVLQVYFRHVRSNVPQPKLALCAFTRVHLKRGESKMVSIEVPATRLRYWDTEKKQYMVEPGDYEILIGAASDDIRLKLPMTITAP
jgi:beta-glucosidase